MKNRLLSILAILFLLNVLPSGTEAQGLAKDTRAHKPRSARPGRTFQADSHIIRPPLSPKELSMLSTDTVALPFFDNVEGGENGWTRTGFEHLITDPQKIQVLNPTINPNLVVLPDAGQLPGAFSGRAAWWYGEDSTGTFIGNDFVRSQPSLSGGTSTKSNSGSLVSPLLDLRRVTVATLAFRTWWEIEGVNSDAFDVMYVEISTDGGANWSGIGTRGKINPLNDPQGESWKAYTSGGLGLPGVWVRQVFDLTPFVGTVAYIRFRFDTRDALYNGFRGWFIDDVGVTSSALPAPKITSITPRAASAGGIVSIKGSNFVNGAVVSVGLNQASSAVVSDSAAIFDVPFLTPGPYDITLTNDDGQSATLKGAFSITTNQPPHITSVSPDSTQAGKPVFVTINGLDFKAGATAEIGGLPLGSVAVVDSTKITGNSPSALLPGNYNVRVINPDGQFDQLISGFKVTFGVTFRIIALTVGPGFIVPKDTVLVAQGASQTFTISVVQGAQLDSVVVDGVNKGKIPSYTFTGVTVGHLIIAYFSPVSGLVVTSPDSVLLGNNPTVTVTIPAGFQPRTKELYYRNGGQTTFQKVNLTGTGNNLVGTFPPAAVNIRGVEYYIKVADTLTTITYPLVNPDIFPAVIRVDVQRALMPLPLAARRYKMISVPLELNDTTLAGVLADDFGQYDPNRWRVFRWEDTANVEFPAIKTGVTPGKAFWLITSGGNVFDVRGGKSLSSSQPYDVKLRPGWNQFANPFAFPVAWSNVNSSVSPGQLRGPYRFDGVQYSIDTTVLMPWEGYFVLNTDTLQGIQVSVQPVESSVIPKMAYRHAAANADEYIVHLSAEVPGTDLRDTQNFLGFRLNAAEGKDPFDYPKPPPIGDYVQLAILDHGVTYMENFKPAGTEGQDWDVRVRSNAAQEQIVITVGTTGNMPEGFGLFLLDLDNENLVTLANNTFQVNVSAHNAVRSFKVILGTKAYAEDRSKGIPLVPLEFRLEQNFPNPFNPETTIRYQLANRSNVTLEVFNMLGQKVRTLVNDVQSTGTYAVTWNARGDDDRQVASGVYVCRLRANESSAVRKLVLVR